MGLIAAGVVVAVGLVGAIAVGRRGHEPDESDSAQAAVVVKASTPGSAFLPLVGKLPAGASRAGFVSSAVEGRRVAQMTSQSKLVFRLTADSGRYGISAIARLTGASAATLTPVLDEHGLSPWALGETWGLHASVVDGSSLHESPGAKADMHELLFAAGDLPAGATIEVESVSIAPLASRVSFETGPQSEAHWIDGFHRRERGAIWSRGLKSAIGVVIEPSKGSYQLKVRGRTLAGLGPLLVEARINEKDVGSAEVTTKVDDVIWAVPAGVLASGANRIELEYPKTGKPAAFNPSSRDTRELAFRISALELAPAD